MKNQFVRKLSIVLLVVVTLFTFIGCNRGKNKTTNADKDIVKFGAILPLTGGMSRLGIPVKNALELAIENDTINKIKVLFQDNKSRAIDGINAYKNLKNTEDINFSYIFSTPIIKGCLPIIDKDETLTFLGSALSELCDQSNWAFRVFAGGYSEFSLMSNYLSNNTEKVFVIHTNETYGETYYKHLADHYTKNGGTIVGVEKYKLGETDFRNIISKINQSSYDKIVVLGYGTSYSNLLKQLKEFRIKSNEIVLNLGGTNSDVISLEKEYTDGTIFIAPKYIYELHNGKLNNDAKRFAEDYKHKYGSYPDYNALYAYDTYNLLNEVIYLNPTHSSRKIREQLLAVQSFSGISGQIDFYSNGDSSVELAILVFKNGQVKMAK